MSFPASPRVIYQKNPLESVVAQVRFPPILRIDAAPPAGYQDRVRNRYPMFNERPAVDLGLALPKELKLPPDIAKLVRGGLGSALRGGNTVYDFASADEAWKISLSRDFLALTTERYLRWEEFRAHFEFAFQVLREEFEPAFFTRLGLRYRDVLKRSELGLGGRPWADLLQPHIAGELSSPEVGASVVHAVREVTMNLDRGAGQVRIRHGLGEAAEAGETPYIIDADFFTDERTETGHAIERLDYFNSQAGRLFRWCIRSDVHEALGPRPL